jgi:hypothetical protein
MGTSSISHSQINQTKCGNIGVRFFSRLSLSLSFYLLRFQMYANQVARAGRVAFEELVTNDRVLSGLGMGMVGFISMFAYLLFPEGDRSYIESWYFVNWFYYLETIRGPLALIFFSACFHLVAPAKYKSIWIVYALATSTGVCGVIHYSFFVTDFHSYHALPNMWLVILPSFGLGFGFMKAMDYLCYRKYHLKDGNLARIKGIIKAPNISAEQKMDILEKLIEERESLNEKI